VIVVAQIGMKLVQHEEPQTSVFPQPPGGALSYTTLDLPPETDAVDSALYMGETGAGSIHRYLKAVMLQKGNCVRAHTFKISRRPLPSRPPGRDPRSGRLPLQLQSS